MEKSHMDNTTPIVKVSNLVKSFGSVKAVKGISFELKRGNVTGFIGANGSGKTTTMRMLATLEIPYKGTILVNGTNEVDYPEETRKTIGWMPDNMLGYPRISVIEYLDFFGRAYGLSGEKLEERLKEVIEFTELEQLLNRPSTKLSKGQLQRLCLARTLIHDPELLILDEPAAGMDPKARLEFKNLIRLLKGKGKTIFISSHILSELAEMCDDFIFIHEGNIIRTGTLENLNRETDEQANSEETSAGTLTIRCKKARAKELATWLELRAEIKGEIVCNQGTITVELSCGNADSLEKLLSDIVSAGFPIYQFSRNEERLEEKFVRIVKEAERKTNTVPPPFNQ